MTTIEQVLDLVREGRVTEEELVVLLKQVIGRQVPRGMVVCTEQGTSAMRTDQASVILISDVVVYKPVKTTVWKIVTKHKEEFDRMVMTNEGWQAVPK
jgi:hypothetical protein